MVVLTRPESIATMPPKGKKAGAKGKKGGADSDEEWCVGAHRLD